MYEGKRATFLVPIEILKFDLHSLLGFPLNSLLETPHVENDSR